MEKVTTCIYQNLCELFPNAKCELEYVTQIDLLVAVMLSAQTTDKMVNSVTKELFSKYHSINDYAMSSLNDLEMIIKRLGLYKNKAKNIILTCQKLVQDGYTEVPNDYEYLLRLPGVGRKTTNVFLSEWYNEPYIAVDTHVFRVSKRLGLADETDNVLKVEQNLMEKFSKDQYHRLHHLLIFFGRYMCKAQNPDCFNCPFKEICKKTK